MFKDKRAASLGRAVFFAIFTSLLIAVGIIFPLLSFWGLLICPLPLALLGCFDGAWWLGGGVLMVEVFLLGLSPSLALYFVLGCMPLSIMLFLLAEKSAWRHWTGGESMFVSTATSVVAKLAVLAVFWGLTGHNILIPDIGQMASLLGGLPPEQALPLQEAIQQAAVLLPYMTPALIMLWAELEAIVNYALCGRILRRWGVERRPPDLPAFTGWRFPASLLPVMVLSIILGFFLTPDKWLEGAMFVINLRLILNVLFFVQGLSLVLWWAECRNFRPLLRTLIFVLALIPLAWMWLILLGVGDMAFDFRTRINQVRK